MLTSSLLRRSSACRCPLATPLRIKMCLDFDMQRKFFICKALAYILNSRYIKMYANNNKCIIIIIIIIILFFYIMKSLVVEKKHKTKHAHERVYRNSLIAFTVIFIMSHLQ